MGVHLYFSLRSLFVLFLPPHDIFDHQGRPLRVRKTPFIMDWEENKQAEIKEKTSKGILPVGYDTEERPYLMGVVASEVHEVLPSKQIIEEMVKEAVQNLNRSASFVVSQSRL